MQESPDWPSPFHTFAPHEPASQAAYLPESPALRLWQRGLFSDPNASPLFSCLLGWHILLLLSFSLTSGVKVPHSIDWPFSLFWVSPDHDSWRSLWLFPLSFLRQSILISFVQPELRNALLLTALLARLYGVCYPSLLSSLPINLFFFPLAFSVAPHTISPSASRWRTCIGKGKWHQLCPFLFIPDCPPDSCMIRRSSS